MERTRRSLIPTVIIAAALLLILAQALPGPSARAQAPGGAGPQSMPGGEPITYYATKGTSIFRVPARHPSGFLSPQSATFSVNFMAAGTTTRFNPPDLCQAWPANAQAAFSAATTIWGTLLNSPVPVVINACWADMGSGGILGHSGSNNFFRDFSGAPVASTWYPVALANALHGSDLDAAGADMDIAYNLNQAAFTWYFGTDGNPPPADYDFVSVVLHEIAHGLGFAGSMQVSGSYGSWGGGTGLPIAYDRFAENGSFQSLLNTGLFPNPGSALKAQLTSNNIYFKGTHATAANSGAHAKLYAPSTWISGSSYSHLDAATFDNTANALMTWSLNNGESNHDPGPVGMGVLEDVGWTVASPTTPTPTMTPTPTRTPTATPSPTPTVTPLPGPDVSIQKAAILGRPFTPGDRITYTLNVANLGSQTANGVRVTDTLPASLVAPMSYASSLVITSTGGASYAWTVAPLAAGASGVISIYARIDPSLPITAVVVNTARISVPQDRDPSNNTSTASSGRFAVYLPLVMRNYIDPSQPTATPTATPTVTPAAGWTIIKSEGFEGTFPGTWSVFDNDGANYGEYFWAKRNCRAFSGSFSGWAVGAGANGAGLSCSASYPNNADSWMVHGPFSLTGATAAQMTFSLWLNSEASYDTLCRLASINGSNFYGTCTSGNTGGWTSRTLDLSNVYSLGNLLGQPNVWVALVFSSDTSINMAEGGYVDDIVIRKCVTGPCTGGSAQAQSDPTEAASGPITVPTPQRQP